uniref:Uncharacterized protein n=1 Tax=Panagrolaimus superbus TaxID=310955 RepID=A0A914Y221_9BILA
MYRCLLLSLFVGLQSFHFSNGACKNGIPIIPKLSTTSTTTTTTLPPTTTSTTTTTTTTTTTPAPTTTTTTPAPLACSTCGNLPFAPPPQGYQTVQSDGIISQSINGAGCKQYVVTCYAFGAKYIVIGVRYSFKL